jgi:hypothetical protein
MVYCSDFLGCYGLKHRGRGCIFAVGGFENHFNGLTYFDRIQVAINNLRHHRYTFVKRHISDAVGIGIASLHDTVGIDLTCAFGLLPRGLPKTKRAKRSRIPMDFAAIVACFNDKLSCFGLLPKILRTGFNRGCRDGVWLIRIAHDQTRSRIRVELPWREPRKPPVPCASAKSQFLTCTAGWASPRN